MRIIASTFPAFQAHSTVGFERASLWLNHGLRKVLVLEGFLLTLAHKQQRVLMAFNVDQWQDGGKLKFAEYPDALTGVALNAILFGHAGESPHCEVPGPKYLWLNI